MKKIIYLFSALCIFNSCGEKKTDSATTENATPAATVSTTESSSETKTKPGYLNGIKYSDWEIGKPEHIKPALDFYTAWDNDDVALLGSLFTDTLRLRIPEERNEIILTKGNIEAALGENRNIYANTSNKIISALSLHDRESNEDWVVITTYNKWVTKAGKRDSLLYNDNWRIKDGKIAFLMSYEKLPTRTFLKKNDPKK